MDTPSPISLGTETTRRFATLQMVRQVKVYNRNAVAALLCVYALLVLYVFNIFVSFRVGRDELCHYRIKRSLLNQE